MEKGWTVSIDLVIVGGQIISCGWLRVTARATSGNRLALTLGFSTDFSFERAETASSLQITCGALIPMEIVCSVPRNHDKKE
jgi:hypothetical protein